MGILLQYKLTTQIFFVVGLKNTLRLYVNCVRAVRNSFDILIFLVVFMFVFVFFNALKMFFVVFSTQLAANADLFVNDAFGTAHRAHGSTEGVTKYLSPSVAGFLLQKELDYLQVL